jgi:hypothetical protein
VTARRAVDRAGLDLPAPGHAEEAIEREQFDFVPLANPYDACDRFDSVG